MKIENQKLSLPILNHDILFTDSAFKKHGTLLGGNSKRGILVGPSGSGKTNVMLSLLQHPNGLRFHNLYVYAKSLYQPKYEYLRMLMKSLPQIGYFEFNNVDDVIEPADIRPNSVIIFDDIQCANSNDLVKSYYAFGRHKNTDVFYQAQTYSAVPKQIIRDNLNYLIIFVQNKTNLQHIYDDHVNPDMTFGEFQNLCSLCFQEKYGFLLIDKECNINEGRYRKGFDKFILV